MTYSVSLRQRLGSFFAGNKVAENDPGPRLYSTSEIDSLRQHLRDGNDGASAVWEKRGIGLNPRLAKRTK